MRVITKGQNARYIHVFKVYGSRGKELPKGQSSECNALRFNALWLDALSANHYGQSTVSARLQDTEESWERILIRQLPEKTPGVPQLQSFSPSE
jgi:hypothetical protein